MRATGADAFLGFMADTFQRGAQSGFAVGHREGAVDHAGRRAHELPHGEEFRCRQHRTFQLQQVALAGVLVQHVAQVAQPGLQRHHAGFAQTVNRRVGDLAKGLTEKMVQAPITLRQHGDRRVITHRADGFLRILHHRMEQHLLLLQCEADCNLAAAQGFGVVDDRLDGVGLDDVVDDDDVFGPVAEGLAGG